MELRKPIVSALAFADAPERRALGGSAVIAAMALVLGASCATSSVESDAGGDPNTPIDGGDSIDASDLECSNSPCDLYEQCGCAPPQVCDLDRGNLPTGATECRDVTSPGTEQAECGTTLTDCAAGYICLGGQCRAYCQADGECGADAFCNLEPTYTDGGGNSIQVPGAVTCSKSCALGATVNNNCPEGYGCNVFISDLGLPTEYRHTDCHRAGVGGNGASCTTNGIRDCSPGYTCVIFSSGGNESGRECRQNCRVVGGSCETGGLSCRAYTGGGTILGGVEYGFCD